MAVMIGVILGMILGLIFQVKFFSSLLWLVVVALIFIYAYIRPNYVMMGACVVAGVLISLVRISGELVGQSVVKKYVGEAVEIVGIIKADPDTDESGTKYKLTKLIINGKSVRGTIFVSGGKDEKLERGDKVVLSGKMSGGFGVYAGAMYRASVKGVAKPEPKDVTLAMRDWFSDKVKEKMPEREASLGLAYLLGMKTGLDDELMMLLRVVGLTHIVVASGTHLGIIVGAGKKIFMKISRFAGVFLSLVLVVGFGSMVGWTASITRAAIVCGLSLLAWYVGRSFAAWRIILIAMAVTLLIDPMYLVDLGWLLSFGSFVGIMMLSPEITKLLYGAEKPKMVAEIIITTISATLMCAPILLYYFGEISLISVLANLLILPTVPAAMGMTLISGLISFVPILSDIVVKITTLILDYHLVVMESFGKWEMFLVKIEAGNPWVFLLYIPVVVPFAVVAAKRIKRRRDLENVSW